MKQKKSMILLLGILAVLLVLYFGLQAFNSSKDKQKEKEAKQSEVYVTDEDELSQFSYVSAADDKEMGFVKEQEQWKAASDQEIPLIQSQIETIADTIASLKATRKLTSPDAKSDYGFDTPAYTIQFTNGEKKESTLYIGGTAGEDYYACRDGSEDIYTIDSTLVSALVFDIDSLVQKDTVPSISSGNLKKVEVTQSGETKTFDSDEDIAELAGGLGTLMLDTCVNYHVSDEETASYGLDEASRITVKAVYQDADTKEKDTLIMYIGNKDADGANRYVRLDGSDIVYSVSSDVVENAYMTVNN